jgi:hypothetical protein
MALKQSKTALGQIPVVSALSARLVGIPFEYVTDATLATGDIIEMGPIEAGVKPFNVHLYAEDLDTNGAPTITLSVGILNAAKTDIDAAATSTWIAASTVGQTGGVVSATTANAYLSGATAATRKLGVKVVAGPATFAGAGKKIAVVISATA